MKGQWKLIMRALKWILVILITLQISATGVYGESRQMRLEPLRSSEFHIPRYTLDREPPQRCAWYREKLGAYSSIINREAENNRIPPNLLATVILNELADISPMDIRMDLIIAKSDCSYEEFMSDSNKTIFITKRLGKHSFGIAQITPATALKHEAIRVPSNLSEEEKDFYVACRLLDRPTSIAVAARIVRAILVHMERVRYTPVIAHNVRRGESFSADDPYRSLGPPTGRVPTENRTGNILRQREMILANLVTMTYNTEKSLTMTSQEYVRGSSYPDARKHGDNGSNIAADLFEMRGCDLGLVQWKHIITPDNPRNTERSIECRYGEKAIGGFRQCFCVEYGFGSPRILTGPLAALHCRRQGLQPQIKTN